MDLAERLQRLSRFPSGTEDLIGPAVVEALNGEVGLVCPVVPVGTREAPLQGLEALKPKSPLRPTFL